MGVKLGSGDALLYLGDTVADRAYLGAAQVPRTLYFNGAEDSAWTTLGNWWFDSAHTVAATSLPTAADSVVVSNDISASGQTVANFTLGDGGWTLSGTLTVTDTATFNASSSNGGTVTGDATFNDDSSNLGTVTGTVTCNTTGTCTPS